jgi:hypothetical protein
MVARIIITAGVGAAAAIGHFLQKKMKAKNAAAWEAKRVTLVRGTWSAVESIGLEPAGVLFFQRIFEIAPGALQLFSFKAEADLYNSKVREVPLIPDPRS